MTSLADVFIEVRPDTSHFSTELKQSLARTREAVDVAANLDTAKLKPQLDRLKADLKSITVTKANITADSAKASANIKALRSELRGLSDNVKINADDTEALARIAEIKTELATLGDARAKLNVDSSLASAHVKALQAQLQVFDGKTATADVKVRGADGVNFMFRGVSSLTTAVVGLAPIAVPALAAVAAGIGTVGAAALAAGGAAGVWGGVLAGALASYKKDVQAIQKLSAGLGSDPVKNRLIHSQIADIRAGWSDAEKQFDVTQEKFTAAFGALVKASGPATFGVLNTGMVGLMAVMPRLAPIIDATGRAVEGLISELIDFTKTQRFQSILDFFLVYGPSAITHFGHIAGNILLGVFNLFAGFAPHGANFLRTFENMTARFQRWSAGFGRSGGFQRFMGYAQRVLPDVRDLFINLTEFAGKFIVALGPLGGIELRVVTLFLEGLNSLPPRVLTGLAFGITGIVLGLKAWELGVKAVTVWNGLAAAASAAWTGAQWLLNAALTANPFGLVIVGIAALAAGLILAYRKSETFRNIVNGALNGVKDAAQAVVRWFRRSFIPFFTDTIPGAFAATKRWVSRNWPAILGIITGPIGWATLFITRHWDTITGAFQDAKDWVVGRFKRAWSDVQGVVLTPIRAARDTIRDIFGSTGPVRTAFTNVKNWATGTFKRAWAALQAVILDPIRDARDKIRDIFGARGPVRTAFTNAVGGIKRIWSNLRDAIRDPIAFVVNTVFNKGIVPFVNQIPFIKGTLHTIQGFAGGGYTGPGAKNEPAGIVHRDEHVWTKEESNRFPGGHQGLERLRARARAGALREGEFAGREMLPGYATGGRVIMDGKALSVIAARQIRLMERMAGVNFRVMQGGYGGSHIAASGTSHNYPGVADFSPASIQYERLARRVGFAAWARNIPGRSRVGSGAHIHAVSLLDPGDARSAQVYGSWRNHGNGLSGANNDPAPHVPWLPNLRQLLGNIPLANLGGGGGGGGGYTGPSAADVRAGLNPAKWVRTLRGMGGWGRGLGGMVTGVVGNLRDAIIDKVKAAIRVAGRALTGGAGPTSGPVSQAVRRVANTYGWGQGDEWNALSNIISHESGWRLNAANPNSSARGLFQKMTSLHGPIERTAEGQAVWGLNYIKDRYGDPIGAWEHWQRNRSYDGGGVARGRGVMVKDTIGPERVLTDRQTDTYDKLLPILERIERGGTGTGPVRIILDAGGGVTLTGHIDNRIQGRQAQSATVRRQRR